MTRRSFAQVVRDTIVSERSGALSLARVRCGEIDRLVKRGVIDAAQGDLTKRHLVNFADDLAIGLHRDGHDPEGVRDALRSLAQAGALAERKA